MRYSALLGRILYSAIFVTSPPFLFSPVAAGYAGQHGVPAPGLLVPLAGAIALVGGLSVLLGYRARVGAWLIVLFLVPVTLMMHNFWAEKDPMAAQMQLSHFLKNLSMLGGALLITQFGPGPLSLDARRQISI